jgi:hypothetical protein
MLKRCLLSKLTAIELDHRLARPERLGDEELELAGLVATADKSGQVVALDP